MGRVGTRLRRTGVLAKGRRISGPLVSAGLAAGLATLLAAPGSKAVHAEPLTLGYLVGWGHLTLAEGEISYSQSEGRYHLVGSGRTRGFLDFFFTWSGRAETEGVLSDGRRRSLVHQHEGTWNENSRRVRVDWNGAAEPQTEAEPPPDLEVVTPVPKASTAGTSDPFTVTLSLLDRLAATGRCEGAARIWDGRRRYDVQVTHLGEETLKADRPWTYEGRATRCVLEFERIGGFWREKPGWRDPDDEASIRRLVWAAEIEPGRWALVRAEMETLYGTVVGRLLSGDHLDSES